MTSDDDPFGRRDRTIIRPNPGGRRPATPASPEGPVGVPQGGAAPHSQPTPPVSYPAPAPPPPPTSRPADPYAAPRPASQPPPGGQAAWDSWMTPQSPPQQNLYAPPGAAQPMTPAPVAPHVSVDLVTVAASPLMRSAASLLVLLGRLR